MTTCVDILCSAYQAAAFIDETLDSAVRQTHRDWRLWVRDDASRDDTADRVAAWAARDPRIRLVHRGAPNLGVVAGFASLLEQLPADTRWVACLDADDVWRTDRLACSLAAGQRHEAVAGVGRPLLVHSDATLIDAAGRPLAASYWARAGLRPDRAAVTEVAIQNVATSSTLLMNRALVDRLRPMPTTGPFSPDWWCTLTAAAFGDIVALDAPLMAYRQHTGNDVGATQGGIRGLSDLAIRVRRVRSSGDRLRRDVGRTAGQAGAFARRYADVLPAAAVAHLTAVAALPTLPFWARKVALARYRLVREHGLLRNLGVLLRG